MDRSDPPAPQELRPTRVIAASNITAKPLQLSSYSHPSLCRVPKVAEKKYVRPLALELATHGCGRFHVHVQEGVNGDIAVRMNGFRG